MKFYINLTFSLVTPPCKAAPPGAWLGRLLELSSSSQTIQSHAPTNISDAKLDQTIIVDVDSPNYYVQTSYKGLKV